MKGRDALFSSNSNEWETPKQLFNKLNKEFNFVLDAAATKENALCDQFFDLSKDALKCDWVIWSAGCGGSVFLNPPYGDKENICEQTCKKRGCVKRGYHRTEYKPGMYDWMKKSYNESKRGATVVCLIPSRTDTAWWHDFCMKATEIRFIKRRLKFENRTLPQEQKLTTATFPSCIVIFKPSAKMLHVKSEVYKNEKTEQA